MRKLDMRMHSERGVALFLALILISTLSVLTVSLMFLAQSESFASSNYRLMTQARYGAEAGVQKAADFILNSDNNANKYDINTSNVLIPSTVSPVKFGIDDVVLSSDPAVTSHYPDAATIAAFQAATTGQLVAGNSTVTYTTTAKLLGIDSFQDAYGGGASKIVQTWEITSNATIAGTRKSTVQVSAIIDAPKFPAISYGAFAADPGCGALSLNGSVSTDSYTSNKLGSAAPSFGSDGDVGSNGNIAFNGGGIDVNGNLSTPRQGVGACTANAVTACTGSSVCNTTSLQQLPQAVNLPAPHIPTYSTKDPVSISSADADPTTGTCNALGLTFGTNCKVTIGTGGKPDYIVVWNNPGAPAPTLPSIDLHGDVEIVLLAPPIGSTASNEYDINSISLSGHGSLGMDTDKSQTGVVVNVVGKDKTGANIVSTPVINFTGDTGGSKKGTYDGLVVGQTFMTNVGSTECGSSCSQYEAALMQFAYGGDTGSIFFKGNSDAAATLYAPKADATFQGSVEFYGAIIAKKLTLDGNFKLHYDTSLSGVGMTAGPPMISSFSWKKY